VNGSRGNAADHLTMDVIPYVSEYFDVGAGAQNWAVTGFSAGGTCAVDLAVMHPELFSAFVDIAGDRSPNAGTKDQTVDRLYGGDIGAWSAFDPATAITRHAGYTDLSGRFVVPAVAQPSADGYLNAARTLCDLGRSRGIDCEVLLRPGRHVWPFGATAFADSLAWLAAELGLPSGVDDPPRG
jgi:S-formylglutathione hydrolase FrmB